MKNSNRTFGFKARSTVAIAAGILPLSVACAPPSASNIDEALQNGVVGQMLSEVTCYKASLGGINVGKESRERMAHGLPALTSSGADYHDGVSAAVDPYLFGGKSEMRARARNGNSHLVVIDTNHNGKPDTKDQIRHATDTGSAITGTDVDMSAPIGTPDNWCANWGRQLQAVFIVDRDKLGLQHLI